MKFLNKKNLIIIGVVIIIAIVGLLFIYKPSSGPVVLLKDGEVTEEGLINIVDANNEFAFDLYSKYQSEDGNIFFSPLSISSALAMTYEGARGQTAEEIQSVFHFPKDSLVMRSAYANLNNEINKENNEYKISIANALWAEQDFTFLDEYFDLVKQYYDGGVTNLDFKNNSENSRITINSWVEDKTNDKIKNLIPRGLVDKSTRLVLTNAIYFKGDWIKQFNEDKTEERDFALSSGDKIKVETMKKTGDESRFKYFENKDLQVLEMPYSGEELSMLILLPKDNDMQSLEKSISVNQLSKWKKGLEEQRVNVYIPKFKFETKYFMADDLKDMGMPIAFSGVADFSGMTGKTDLMISELIHQAFVEVDEKGTEAAAATAVVMMESAMPGSSPTPQIPVFRADHPFIFIIQQNNTGNILFMGRVNNPEESSI